MIYQVLPNEEISKSEILEMVSAMRSSENTDKDKVEKLLPNNVYELSF
jgi:hypothetical protein